MTTPATVDKPAKTPIPRPGARRVTARFKEAVRLRLQEGLTWDECAREAGLAPSALYKAKNRPHCAAYLAEQEALYVKEIEALKARHKARAIQIAAKMLEDNKNPANQRFAVEFFAGESKKTPPVVINNNVNSNGYAYIPPNAEIVDIKPNDDKQLITNQDHESGNREE